MPQDAGGNHLSLRVHMVKYQTSVNLSTIRMEEYFPLSSALGPFFEAVHYSI